MTLRSAVVASIATLSSLVLPISPTLAESPAIVSVSGQVSTTLMFPGGPVPVVLIVHATARGSNSALAGRGGHVALADGQFFLERSEYDLTSGWADTQKATLAGTISNSMARGLVGAPIVIDADTSGHIQVTIGPIPGGPFAGQTHTFTGSGATVIKAAP